MQKLLHGRRQTTMQNIMMLQIMNSKSNQDPILPALAPTLTSHHFYSLNEDACQILLQLPSHQSYSNAMLYRSLSQAKTLPITNANPKQCHSRLPTPAKEGRKNKLNAPYAQYYHNQKPNSSWQTITTHCIPPQITQL